MTLETAIEETGGVGPKLREMLHRLKIKTVGDLLFHFPHRHEDFSNTKNIGELVAEEKATIVGKIVSIKNSRTWKRRMAITEAFVEDKTGVVKAVWFNQPFFLQTLRPDLLVSFYGKV
jgi:ATP-dependent DNA helicase RecG